MSDWMTRHEVAAACDRTPQWVEKQRKLGNLRARKEPRQVDGYNGHAMFSYLKPLWVFHPDDAARMAEEARKPRKSKYRPRVRGCVACACYQGAHICNPYPGCERHIGDLITARELCRHFNPKHRKEDTTCPSDSSETAF